MDYKDIVRSSSLVNRRWNYLCGEDLIWKELIKHHYHTDTLTSGYDFWCEMFKDKKLAEKKQSLIVCFGYTHLRMGFVPSNEPSSIIPAVFHNDDHPHVFCAGQYFFGDDILQNNLKLSSVQHFVSKWDHERAVVMHPAIHVKLGISEKSQVKTLIVDGLN